MKLILLRHGESEANVAGVFSARRHDVGLSAAGQEQAATQAARLGQAGIAGLYASPLLRARQTAACVSEATGLPVQFTDTLLEFDVGALDGCRADEGGAWKTYEEVRRQWQAGREEAGFEQGETLADAGRRLSALLGSLPHDPDGPIVLVGHGMIFMTLLWLFCENRGATLQDNYMGRGHLTLLSRAGTGYRIEQFNVAPGQPLSALSS